MPNGDEVAARAEPLTETDLQDIDRALTRLGDAEALMVKAQQAGIDIEAFRQRARESKDRLLAIKQSFFPGR